MNFESIVNLLYVADDLEKTLCNIFAFTLILEFGATVISMLGKLR